MTAGEERNVRYSVVHTYYGGQAEEDHWHRHNGTHMHKLIAMTASFATVGVRVSRSTSRDRNAPARRPGRGGCPVGPARCCGGRTPAKWAAS